MKDIMRAWAIKIAYRYPPVMHQKKFPILVTVAALALTAATAPAQTNYPGNGQTGFDGPVGNGILTLTSNGTTLTGTITPGLNNGAGNPGILFDELVIYIDSTAGGYNSTSGFTDTGGGGDTLRRAISGFSGTARAPLNFAPSFGADFAIGISPVQGLFGGLFQLGADQSNFGFVQNASLSPTGNSPAAAGPYTFSISLANIGSPTSFNFSTTYGNFHSDAFRSNEAFGNTITDVTTPGNTGNLGQDTGLVGFSTFTVPEPGTTSLLLLGIGGVICMIKRPSLKFLRNRA